MQLRPKEINIFIIITIFDKKKQVHNIKILILPGASRINIYLYESVKCFDLMWSLQFSWNYYYKKKQF